MLFWSGKRLMPEGMVVFSLPGRQRKCLCESARVCGKKNNFAVKSKIELLTKVIEI
jgi:hypothetical protein